jgi:hypothetical protein
MGMAGAKNSVRRDEKDDAKARAWSRQAKQRAEAGLVRDDTEWGRRKAEELRSRLAKK